MPLRIDAVLVATDGSDAAARAAEHAVALAASTDADVHALSVVSKAASRTARTALGDQDGTDVLEAERERAASVVTDIAAEHPEPPDVTTAIRSGSPHREISAYAEDHGVDVVVVGTQGRSGLDRVLLGSITERVLRTSARPVLTVPPGASDPPAGEAPYRDLLLPTDGSQGAERALEWALWLATTVDAPVHALFAADTTPLPTAVRSEQLLEKLEAEGNQALDTVRDRADAAGIEVTSTVSADAPASTILDHVEEAPIDLIAMGTHGRSGVGRLLLGSVTEDVVRHSDVPVFCVPAGEEE